MGILFIQVPIIFLFISKPLTIDIPILLNILYPKRADPKFPMPTTIVFIELSLYKNLSSPFFKELILYPYPLLPNFPT